MSKIVKKFQDEWGTEKVYYAENEKPMIVVPTGSISLDFAIGIGGIPQGRLVEIFGPESVGKTSLAYYIIAEHQKAFPNKPVLFCNIEGGFDPQWAQRIAGVEIKEEARNALVIASADPGTESVEMVGWAVESGEFSLVVYDSIGAMLGDKERKPGEKKQAFGQAQMVTHMTKLCTQPAYRTGTSVIFLNQVRDDVSSRGLPRVKAPGGRAAKHQAAIRIELKKGYIENKKMFSANIFGEKIEVGFRVAADVIKNKTSAPRMKAGWNFYTRPVGGVIGIDRQQEIADLSLNTRVIEQRGKYYYNEAFPEDSKGERRIETKDALFEFLKGNDDVREQVRLQLMDLAYRVATNNGNELALAPVEEVEDEDNG